MLLKLILRQRLILDQTAPNTQAAHRTRRHTLMSHGLCEATPTPKRRWHHAR